MDELNFDFGEEQQEQEGAAPLSASQSQDSKATTGSSINRTSFSSKRCGRTKSSRHRRKFHHEEDDDDDDDNDGRVNESFSSTAVSSADSSRTSKVRRSHKQQQSQSQSDDGDLEDEIASTVSSSSSKESSSTATALSTPAVSVVRSKKNRAMIRGGLNGAYAVQDAGNYQMLHDECAFLCSTILSRRRHPSKAVDATIDLVTMLSSRKTRAVLWQGGQQQNQQQQLQPYDNSPELDRSGSQDIPKLWRSILEIIAVMTQQDTSKSPRSKLTSNDKWSVVDDNNKISLRVGSPIRARTKAARQKQKEMMQDAGGGGGDSSVANSSVGSIAPIAGLTAEMKEALACLIYFLSCDCTMSPIQSVAVMGGVKMPSLARKIRLGILEFGPALSGIVRLMMPSTNAIGAAVSMMSHTLDQAPPVPPPRLATAEKIQQQAKSPPPLDFVATQNESSGNKANPAKMGRILRLKRKRLAKIAEKEEGTETDEPDECATARNSADEDSKVMPPPSKRIALDRLNEFSSGVKSDDFSFKSTSVASGADLSFPDSGAKARKPAGSHLSWDEDTSLASDATGLTSTLSNRAAQKLSTLRSKVLLESTTQKSNISSEMGTNLQEAFYRERMISSVDAEILPPGDYPWVTIVCLESLNRIMTGKVEGGTSCLEGEDTTTRGSQHNDDDSVSDEEDESRNPIVMTNRMLGKSGAVPLLGKAMSLSIASSCKLIFERSQRLNGISGERYGSELREDGECWRYCQDRLSLIASIIDGCCLLSESNRRAFCEEDPFAFEERKDGLVFQILQFLRECSESNLQEEDERRSATMLLALRTMTSLTHDNGLAAEQMALPLRVGLEEVRGVEILAELIFQLEEPGTLSLNKAKPIAKGTVEQSADHDMHRYDCTIFCFNTLANVIDGHGVRQVLTEFMVQQESLGATSWLKWLCRWFVDQTETFREELMSIGKDKQSQGSAKKVTPAPSRSNKRNGMNYSAANEQDSELQKHEEEKLVAAGNCCVVLACMMIGPENGDIHHDFDPKGVRQTILEEIPESSEGDLLGVSLIINTLKAFCNYYHLSLGELSIAVVAPVKKLIRELEEAEEISEEEHAQGDGDGDGENVVDDLDFDG